MRHALSRKFASIYGIGVGCFFGVNLFIGFSYFSYCEIVYRKELLKLRLQVTKDGGYLVRPSVLRLQKFIDIPVRGIFYSLIWPYSIHYHYDLLSHDFAIYELAYREKKKSDEEKEASPVGPGPHKYIPIEGFLNEYLGENVKTPQLKYMSLSLSFVVLLAKEDGIVSSVKNNLTLHEELDEAFA
jgi:hypothetical protein